MGKKRTVEYLKGARCPECGSTEVTCDGVVHKCVTCGFDGIALHALRVETFKAQE